VAPPLKSGQQRNTSLARKSCWACGILLSASGTLVETLLRLQCTCY